MIILKDLKIDPSTGLIQGAPFYKAPIPNSEDRANPNDISLLVIHDTEIVASDTLPYHKSIVHYMFTQQYPLLKKEYPEEFKALFPEEKTRDVAAHIVLRRNGEIIQYVAFNRLAHHAGVSEFENRENCNEFSIGIELEGFANCPEFLYTEAQYQQLAILTRAIMETYPKITLERIIGHEHIARPLGRKTDPGKLFDWEKYKKLVQALGVSLKNKM
jgi:AmpD protein